MNSKSSYPCPKCGENLEIENDYINFIDEIDITCPSCNKKFKGKALLETHSDVNKIKEKTILVREPGVTKEMVGLFIKENFIDEKGTSGDTNQFYEIKNDVTVVGRKSDSSKADIQIPSNRYMSRQHVVIAKMSCGRYLLKWATPTNPPLVNGVVVLENETIALKDGDLITLGQCVIEWKYKPLDENRSILL